MAVVIVCRSSWLPERDEAAREDYQVCLTSTAGDASTLRFPTGSVHSSDIGLASDSDPRGSAFRIAAARIVFEELGVSLLTPTPPASIRAASRDVLRRDGPLVFLDCLIAWAGGDPNPKLTLCPLTELHLADDHGAKDAAPVAVFFAELPDGEELAWAAAVPSSTLVWAEPSLALDVFELGAFEQGVLQRLCSAAGTFEALSCLMSTKSRARL